MFKKLQYILVCIIGLSTYPLFAQEVEYEYAKEKNKLDQSIDAPQMADYEMMENVYLLDSLSNAAFYSSQNVSDSLRKQLNTLNQGIIKSRLDSLRSSFDSKFSKNLNKFIKGKNSFEPNQNNELSNLEKLQLPGISGLKTNNFGLDDLSVRDHSLKSLISNVEQQLGEINNIKNDIDIKRSIPGSQHLNEINEYRDNLNDPSKLDREIDDQVSKLNEFQSLNDKSKELISLKQIPESIQSEMNNYQNISGYQDEVKTLATKQAAEYIANNQSQISEAQNKMKKLKNKYSKLQDSRDLSTAVRATSLKDQPHRKRFDVGLGIQFQQTNPISLDLAPNIMYRMNSMFSVGISGTYRVSLGIENNKAGKQNTLTDVYGASVFAQHIVWKGFFAHSEFEYLNAPIKDLNTSADLVSRKWSKGALLGIGKMINLSKALNGQVIFTYDFLHDKHSPNPKAWAIKFGFQFGRLKLKDFNL